MSSIRRPFAAVLKVAYDLDATPEALAAALDKAAAFPERRRAGEGQAFAAGLRRYTMLTGRDYTPGQTTPPAPAAGGWGCACGHVRLHDPACREAGCDCSGFRQAP